MYVYTYYIYVCVCWKSTYRNEDLCATSTRVCDICVLLNEKETVIESGDRVYR